MLPSLCLLCATLCNFVPNIGHFVPKAVPAKAQTKIIVPNRAKYLALRVKFHASQGTYSQHRAIIFMPISAKFLALCAECHASQGRTLIINSEVSANCANYNFIA